MKFNKQIADKTAKQLQKKYESLSESDKKVMIAQEALTILKQGKVTPISGNAYIDKSTYNVSLLAGEFDIKPSYHETGKYSIRDVDCVPAQYLLLDDTCEFNCKACLIGIAYLAGIKIKNRITIGELVTSVEKDMYKDSPFTERELRLIEGFFEASGMPYISLEEEATGEVIQKRRYLMKLRRRKDLKDLEAAQFLFEGIVEFKGDVEAFLFKDYQL